MPGAFSSGVIPSASSLPIADGYSPRAESVRGRRPDFAARLSSVGADPRSTTKTTPIADNPKTAVQGFVRSDSPAFAPHIPRFTSVPESAQHPQGPYKQAPAELGGEWWLVNPFSGPEPWLRAAESAAAPAVEAQQPSDDFLRIFGPRPDASRHSLETFAWERELNAFGGAGIPDGFTESQVQSAGEIFQEWGMGEPVFYQGRNGWAVRFPDSQSPDFQPNPKSVIDYPHLMIANYQIRVAREGGVVDAIHPLVPPSVFGDKNDTVNA